MYPRPDSLGIGSESNEPPSALHMTNLRQGSADETLAGIDSPTDGGERFFKRNSFVRKSSISQKAKDVLSRQSSNASERFNGELFR